LAQALVASLFAAPARATLAPEGDVGGLDGALDCNTGDPAIAGLAGGGFVGAWSVGARISTRRLDAAGQPMEPAVVVVQGHPSDVEAVALPNGGYALAWWDRTRARVLIRFFDAAGVAGPELEVGAAGPDPGTGFGGLDAAAGAGGTLAVVWTDHQRVLLREMRPDGSALSPAWQVNEGYGQVFQEPIADFSPAVIVAADGTLRVFWVEGLFTPTVSRDGTVQGRRVVHDAAADYRRTQWIVTGAAGHDPEAAMAADGSYLLAWVGTQTYYLDPPVPIPDFPAVLSQAFDAADVPRSPRQVLDGGAFLPAAAVAVAPAPAGGFVVAWETDLPTGVDGVTTALARDLDASGIPRGLAPSRLAPDTSAGQARPDLAVAANGLLVAAWQELEDPDIVFIVCPGGHVRARPFGLGCGEDAACLRDGRFELTLTWSDPRRHLSGVGHPVALTGETTYFWFFSAGQVEVIVKVLDGRAVNGHYWVFWGGLTDLGLRLTVRDTQTGATRTYETAPGTMVSAADTSALPPSAQSAAFSAQELQSFALDREAFASDVAVEPAPAPPVTRRRPSSLPDTSVGPCTPFEPHAIPRPGLCLAGNRFEVEATWRDFAGRTGVAEGVELGDDSGWFWFFDRDNVELVVKVLDGRAVNGRFWVFYGALTNVEYDLVVRNAATGATWTHHNPSGRFASGADVDALAP
jgi:hypothetical protein